MSAFRMPQLARDPERPVALSVVFWVVVVLVVVRYLGYERPVSYPFQDVVFALNMVVLLALWPALPWSRASSRTGTLAAPGFLVATVLLGVTGSAAVHYPLILVGFAAIALRFGVPAAAVVMAALGGVLTASQLWFSPGDVLGVLSEVAVLVLGAVFVLALASALLEARQRREDSERLLARVRELAVAEERARMARDMHDSVGHHLTVIKMGLENAERFRWRRPEAAWDEVRQSKEVTAQALVETRRWVRALRPLDLDGRVGSAALERLARSFDGTGVAVEFTVTGEEHPLDADTELVLYRVLQEGLTNVFRHAEASRVAVRLTFDRDTVTLAVADDGQGSYAGPGFGLTSLTERARALGGDLQATAAPDTGFDLRARLPAGSR